MQPSSTYGASGLAVDGAPDDAGAGRNNGAPLIVLVDDDPEDAYLVRRGFSQIERRSDILHVTGGQALFDWLSPTRGPTPERLPDLILLDINMPGMNGLEVLRRLRASSGGERLVPTLMLSTSNTPESVNRSYALGANAYLCKPRDANGMREMARVVTEFWFGVSDRPDGLPVD